MQGVIWLVLVRGDGKNSRQAILQEVASALGTFVAHMKGLSVVLQETLFNS